MRKEISGTSVATAVLLLAAAILLCGKLAALNADAIRLPPPLALSLEGLAYAAILYIWSGRLSLRAQGLGVPALFAARLVISAGAAGAGGAAGLTAAKLWAAMVSPVWVAWAAAAGFAVVTLYLLRGVLLPAPPSATQRPAVKSGMAPPTPSKVLFDSKPPAPGAPAQARMVTEADGEGDESLFRVLEPRPAAHALRPATLQPMLEIEGWVRVPAAALLEQLPAGTEIEDEQVEIPLALIVPRLREGELRIPVAELDGIISLPPGADDDVSVELPLAQVVPQLPDEALELPPCSPPQWLLVDAELEDIFFAKV
jgi:hypothetical protein